MPRIIALCGLSGVGKTYRRETDPELKNLPYVDVADIYMEEEEGISSRWALQLMLNKIEYMIERGEQTIVVEASFRRRSGQRQWLEYLAGKYDYQVEYIELEAPVEECIERVKRQFEQFKQKSNVAEGDIEKMESYTKARLEILHGSTSCD
jgi:predicted kinase